MPKRQVESFDPRRREAAKQAARDADARALAAGECSEAQLHRENGLLALPLEGLSIDFAGFIAPKSVSATATPPLSPQEVQRVLHRLQELTDEGRTVVVGGQAVYFWAYYLSKQQPTLLRGAPPTSKDLDLWKADLNTRRRRAQRERERRAQQAEHRRS
jgi:hypothetical protein